MTSEVTCIRITKKTRDRLLDLGRKRDTYEDIIDNLLNHYEKTK